MTKRIADRIAKLEQVAGVRGDLFEVGLHVLQGTTAEVEAQLAIIEATGAGSREITDIVVLAG